MADNLAMASHLAGQSVKFGWYFGLRMLSDRQAARYGETPKVEPKRPLPSVQSILTDLGQLILEDAAAVRAGICPPSEADGPKSFADYALRVRAMLGDLPRAVEQRERRDAGCARTLAEAEGLPDYFTQDFHYQDGGYLTENSARLYDIQVETLFMGTANAMRRMALKPIAAHVRGCDQRQMSLLDIACGTGRSLRDYRLVYPAMKMTGLDLSQTYLDEAAAHLKDLRRVDFLKANAETIPLRAASQDIVTMTFLYHELPPDVRRIVAAEVARVLKPGGLFVFIDSIELGDKPDWDGLLEVFPVRFHEPYFRSYAIDDLDAMFTAAGLAPMSTRTAFLSKVIARRKVE